MVLLVWGTARHPGSKVTIRFNDQAKGTIATPKSDLVIPDTVGSSPIRNVCYEKKTDEEGPHPL
jgi:hypothetical protein